MEMKAIVIGAALLWATGLFAQESKDKVRSSSDKAQEVFDGSLNQSSGDSSRTTESVQVTPEYPGGLEAMYKFIRKNFKYSTKSPREGKVYVKFMIDKDGSVTDVVARRGAPLLVEEEAIRMVRAMPRWKPGMIDGVPVRSQFVLPILFRLR